jgi:hypothetical protein
MHRAHDADGCRALEVLVDVEGQGAVGDLEVRVVVVDADGERLGRRRIRPGP